MPPFCTQHEKYHVLIGECGRMRRADHRARMDARRLAHAERIAAEVAADWTNDGETLDADLRLATAAALQALTEKENAR